MYVILKIPRLETNRVDVNEAVHNEPPHRDLRCSQIHLISPLMLESEINCGAKKLYIFVPHIVLYIYFALEKKSGFMYIYNISAGWATHALY